MSEQLDENAKLIEQFHKLEENRRNERILEAELESVRKRLEQVRLNIRCGESVNKIVEGIAIKYWETENRYGGNDIRIKTSSDELGRGACIYVNVQNPNLRGIDLEAWGDSKFHNALPGSFSSGYYRSKNIGHNYTEESAKNIAMQWVLYGLIYDK